MRSGKAAPRQASLAEASGGRPRRNREGAPRAAGAAGEQRSPVTGWPIAAVLAVVAIIVYIIRYALLPFVLALAIAFVAEPLVVRTQRWLGGRRWVAAALLAVLIVAAIGGAAYLIGSAASADLGRFAEQAPEFARRVIGEIAGPRVVAFGHAYTPAEIVQQLGQALAGALGGAVRVASLGIGTIFGGFLTLVLIPYLMVSGPRLAAGALWLIPPERRHSVAQLLPKIVPALRRYLTGILVIVAYTATVAYLGFGLVFRLPGAALLSVAFGVLEIIPVAGPVVSGVLVALTAFEQTSLPAIVVMLAFALALRLTIDNLVGPLVLGKAGRVHPVVVIFAFVCGAMLFGGIGLILAVPTAVCIKITLQHYYAEPIRPAEED